jgi:hypothetical protein
LPISGQFACFELFKTIFLSFHFPEHLVIKKVSLIVYLSYNILLLIHKILFAELLVIEEDESGCNNHIFYVKSYTIYKYRLPSLFITNNKLFTFPLHFQIIINISLCIYSSSNMKTCCDNIVIIIPVFDVFWLHNLTFFIYRGYSWKCISVSLKIIFTKWYENTSGGSHKWNVIIF